MSEPNLEQTARTAECWLTIGQYREFVNGSTVLGKKSEPNWTDALAWKRINLGPGEILDESADWVQIRKLY